MKLDSQESKILLCDSFFIGMSQATNEEIKVFFTTNATRIPTRYGAIGYDLRGRWADGADRTKARYFHGLLFMQGWAKYLSTQGVSRDFDVAANIIQEWRSLHPFESTSKESMAYHDETTAQRLNIVLGIILACEYRSINYDLTRLREFADETASLLLREEFHSGLNNHGMFQDIALRNYAVAGSWTTKVSRLSALHVSADRLCKYFLHAFTSEGVHVENTPTYHLMVARSLKAHLDILRAIESDHTEVLEDLLDKAADYATNVIMPNGTFPPISDTTKMDLRGSAGKIFDSHFAYACTAGATGAKPNIGSKAYKDSGYAIYRSDWDSAEATYLLFQAAYNNDYHKHSDDLSVIIYSGGREIITDPGPYSYNYKDPFSRYAYSQFSHNNIVVDGKSLPRTDSKASSVRITDFQIDDERFKVIGENGRFHDTKHIREIEILGEKRSESINIKDSLISDSYHEFTQHWNIAVGLHVVPHGNGFEVFDGTRKVLDAFIESEFAINVDVVNGVEKPGVIGWSFPKFGEKKTANVVRVTFSGKGNLELDTRFNISKFNYVDRGLVAGSASGWKRFEGERGLNYLEEDTSSGDPNSPLVFVFSAMAPVGNFSYNYKATIDKITCHAFYILDDFGDQGSYYLQENSDRSIFNTVQSFITTQIRKFGSERPVYFVGSSKGGTAALLHGLLFEGAKIFIGAPQTKIGSFVEKPHPNVLSYMTGGVSQEHIDSIDEVLFQDQYFSNESCEVTIAVGLADHHYKNHILPWHDRALKNNLKVRLILLDGTPHSEIGSVYRGLLHDELTDANSGGRPKGPKVASQHVADLAGEVGQHRVWFDTISQRLFATCEPIRGTEVSFRLYKDNDLVDSQSYRIENFTSWANLTAGKYRVRFFRRRKNSADSAKITSPWVEI
ncbi:heparinase II/III domain-containing protein [Glutamicibacter sp. AOP38-B1-38]|uniref:heparinase II/III domain-containing protein n=1 Tax=Glutamicibacter sp. AOP38-B1-38 TaxID=3457680 RepID=UPI004034EA85